MKDEGAPLHFRKGISWSVLRRKEFQGCVIGKEVRAIKNSASWCTSELPSEPGSPVVC